MMPDPAVIAQTIAGFVTAQMNYWIARRPARESCDGAFEQLNERRPDIFIYRFSGDEVALLPKAGMADDESETGKSLLQIRALRYLALFRQVIAAGRRSFDGALAMSMHDIVAESQDVPVFCFQKRAGSKLLLLPDIDAVSLAFYEHDFVDNVAYDDKSTSAIFIGATTGMHHSVASVAALQSQRLRSGVFFRDRPEVDFRLPTICQCLGSDAEEAIRALGFGVRPGDWTEQFNNRFVLSMDGNGATCSRVAIALKSNSALVKYASPHRLYYFDAMIPWVHYIPALRDSDVIDVVRAERTSPGLFREIASAGCDFHRDFLSRASSLDYTGRLLAAYFDLLAERSQPVLVYSADEAARIDFTATAHLAGHGDIACSGRGWIGEPGSGRAMEGFSIAPIQTDPAIPLAYRVVDAAGEGEWAQAGTFVGDRGRASRLLGFAIEAPGLHCVYHGRYLDGQEIGPLADGAVCLSPTDAPLEALRVRISR